MSLDQSSRNASPRTAIAVRLVAFITAVASALLVPLVLAGAAAGHESVPRALVIVALALATTGATTVAARSVDPLKR